MVVRDFTKCCVVLKYLHPAKTDKHQQFIVFFFFIPENVDFCQKNTDFDTSHFYPILSSIMNFVLLIVPMKNNTSTGFELWSVT